MTPAARLDRAARLLATPAEPVPGQLAVEAVDPECGHGNPRCGTIPARFYPCGWRCEEHQPAKTHPYHRPAAA